ncbi:unnamed protein product [Sphagnum troendelagicum]|uniref:Maturase K n=1 Tax=Sphagnum troendelagicum TaxID=128251 RepID=A0ABP0V4A9_9BRYO
MHKMKSARPTSSLLFAEERELGLGFRQLLKSFSLAFIDQLIERFKYFPSQIPSLFRELRHDVAYHCGSGGSRVEGLKFEATEQRFFSSTDRQQHVNQPSLHH